MFSMLRIIATLALSVLLQTAAYAAGIAVTNQSSNPLVLAPGQTGSVTYSVHRDIPLSLSVAISGAVGPAKVTSNGCAAGGRSQNCSIVVQFTQPPSYSDSSPSITLRSSDRYMGTASASTRIQAATLSRAVIASATSLQLASGKTTALSVSTCGYSNGYVGACLNPVITWKSSHPNIASVSSNGVVTAKLAGTTNITANVNGNPGNAVTVSVSGGTMSSIAVSGPTTAQVGSTVSYTASCKDVNNNPVSCGNITWSLSNNGSSASIGSSSGSVTVGDISGAATVSAKANGIASNRIGLNITPGSLAAVSLSPATVTMQVGGASAVPFTVACTDQYNNKVSCSGLTWLIENAGGVDASINASTGRVTPGKVAGNATVSVALAGVSANARLVIAGGLAASVSVTPTSVNLLAGGSSTAPFTVKCADRYGNAVSCSGLSWSVSNAGAAVSIGASSGSVTPGNTVGTATVTAKMGNAKANATVTVTASSAAIVTAVSGPATAVAGSNAVSYKATCTDQYNNATPCGDVTWSVINSGGVNATVGGSGSVTPGIIAGTTQIIAALGDKKSASTTLTITAGPLAAVRVSPSAANVQAAGSAVTPFTATCSDRYGNTVICSNVVWSIVDAGGAGASIASSTGSVTPGNAAGSATVTATAGSSRSAATLTITPIPLGLTLSPAQPELVLGSSARITTRCYQNGGNGNAETCPQLTWTSNNPAVMTVDKNGMVTAIAPGTAKITAVSSVSNLNATTTLVVSPLIVPNSLFFSVLQPFFPTAGRAYGELAFVNPAGANTLNTIQLGLSGSTFSHSGMTLFKTTLLSADGSVKTYPNAPSTPFCGGTVKGGQTCIFHFVINRPIDFSALSQQGLINFSAVDTKTNHSIQAGIPISQVAITEMSPRMLKGLPVIQYGKKTAYYEYDTHQSAGVYLVAGCDRDVVIKLTSISTSPVPLTKHLQIQVTDQSGKDITASAGITNQCRDVILNPAVGTRNVLIPSDSCGIAMNAGSLPAGQIGYVNLIVGPNQNQIMNTLNLTVEKPNKPLPALQPVKINGEMVQLFQGGMVVRTDQACNRLDFIPRPDQMRSLTWSYSNLATPIPVPGSLAKSGIAGAGHAKNGQLNTLAIVFANSQAQRTKPMPGFSFATYAAGACDSMMSTSALSRPAHGNWYLPALDEVKMMLENQHFPAPYNRSQSVWSSTEPATCHGAGHACAYSMDGKPKVYESQKSAALLPVCFRSLTY